MITRLYIDEYATRRPVALRRRIFKQKKGVANLPRPPSRDTIPLMGYLETPKWFLIFCKKCTTCTHKVHKARDIYFILLCMV
jgi:hypothetical protein